MCSLPISKSDFSHLSTITWARVKSIFAKIVSVLFSPFGLRVTHHPNWLSYGQQLITWHQLEEPQADYSGKCVIFEQNNVTVLREETQPQNSNELDFFPGGSSGSFACLLPFVIFMIYKHLQIIKEKENKCNDLKGRLTSAAETESIVSNHWMRMQATDKLPLQFC